MNVIRSGKLSRTVRRIQKRLASKAVILMYHRVAEVELDPWGLCVTPQHFASHLEVLQKYARPISLQQLTQAHRAGNIPHRAVVVTFDDGYADNLHNAKPILERYNIPATVFITTGHIGSQREFWWDELDRVLLQPGKLPEKLCLEINGSPQKWELGTAEEYSKEDYQRDRDRKAWEALPGSRLAFYYSVWQQLQSLPAQVRQQAQDEILSWAGADATARPTYRSLVLEEIHTLGQGGFVEIGAHTVTHPFLSVHSVAVQREEIQQSKAELEKLLAHPVTSFAYPFGDYTEETVPLIPEAGFACACSVVQDRVWWQSDCFEFPRFGVENWTGEEFHKQLTRWFDG